MHWSAIAPDGRTTVANVSARRRRSPSAPARKDEARTPALKRLRTISR
jgi:hypothetical protein